MDRYRKVCYEFDPLVNSHEPQDLVALERLQNLVIELQNQPSE